MQLQKPQMNRPSIQSIIPASYERSRAVSQEEQHTSDDQQQNNPDLSLRRLGTDVTSGHLRQHGNLPRLASSSPGAYGLRWAPTPAPCTAAAANVLSSSTCVRAGPASAQVHVLLCIFWLIFCCVQVLLCKSFSVLQAFPPPCKLPIGRQPSLCKSCSGLQATLPLAGVMLSLTLLWRLYRPCAGVAGAQPVPSLTHGRVPTAAFCSTRCNARGPLLSAALIPKSDLPGWRWCRLCWLSDSSTRFSVAVCLIPLPLPSRPLPPWADGKHDADADKDETTCPSLAACVVACTSLP